MTLQIILGLIIRHLLTAFGGGVFTEALLAGDTVNQIAGATAGIVGIGLSVLDKKKK